MQPNLTDEFEEWFKPPAGWLIKNESGEYLNYEVQARYNSFCAGWMARYEADK